MTDPESDETTGLDDEWQPFWQAMHEMEIDDEIRPRFMDAVEGRISWEEFRADLEASDEKRRVK
ncbi:MAG: hypothetical protein HKN37_11055 [Rhodothermales bacterium]|nr:hypothetical protein [Rhodothermales bacterium]